MNSAIRGLKISKAGSAACATALLFLTSAAFGQQPGCVELKTSAETEQEYVDDKGQKAKRLVPAAKVAPGDEVVWTVTAKNICDKPADNIVIANPVPEHMTYVANSAIGVGTAITYSLDGKEFKDAAALTVRDANGATRPASAADYRAIRWTYRAPFQPGATAFVRYRAVVK